MRDFGNGSTDYGQMLEDFKSSILKDVTGRTTIIILGDARNNYGNQKSEILREIYERAQRVIWLTILPAVPFHISLLKFQIFDFHSCF